MRISKDMVGVFIVVAMLSAVGLAGASINEFIRVKGKGPDAGRVVCPGGMTRLGHDLANDMTLFEFDPAVHIEDEYTVGDDGFQVEDIDTGAHAGTHLDVPSHFIAGARSLDDLSAEEFIWPAYKIDARDMDLAEDGQLTIADIRDYERDNGRIRPGSLVVLRTGAEEFWGAEEVVADADGNVANVDDFFDFANAGFSGDAVQWLFDHRAIDGVGSDAYGPDAASDGDFNATFTALANDGVALVALKNLDSLSIRGDVIMAPTVSLVNGSGFSTDPIACHSGGAPGSSGISAGDE